MNSGIEAALGRVAVVLRLLGAVWLVLLVIASAVAGQLSAPVSSVVITAGAVLWAVVAWRSGWIVSARRHGMWIVVADLLVTVTVIVGPGLLGETVGFSGGYPFAALLVALAGAGRRGVIGAAVVLIAATLVNLGSVGTPSLSFVTSNVLIYGLGATALVVGVDVIDRQEQRAREAESALVVARERAATATHLHDSVLQTLALVQRRADDADAVTSLARRQERELRDWLFPPDGPAGSTGPADADGSDTAAGELTMRLGAALDSHAEDIQERYGVAVRVITVGGVGALPVGDRLAAVALAAREAMANAAVHSGRASVDVFAERNENGIAVFVRDRGRGFDVARIPDDRHGVRGSIIKRMVQAGGTAEIRSTPERGTEVELRLGPGIPSDGRQTRERTA